MMPINLPHLKQWVGKQETTQDQIYPTPVQAMALSLNHDAASILKAPLRPVWHWLYFLPMSPLSEAGPDGHPDRKSTRLNSSHVAISYAVFCLKKKKNRIIVQQL